MKFRHVLDIFSVLSDRNILIPFHERPVSQKTRLEYQQQGYRSNLKIHFFRLMGSLWKFCLVQKNIFGFPEIIGQQMRYLLQ